MTVQVCKKELNTCRIVMHNSLGFPLQKLAVVDASYVKLAKKRWTLC